MTIRADRTIEDRARLGLGSDTQDDNTDPATDEIALTIEGILDAGAGLEAADVTIADAGAFTATTTVEAALAEIYGRLPITDFQVEDLIIDTTVGDGSDLRATSMVIPVKASSKYLVEATVLLTATANSGWKLGFSGPADATMVWSILAFPADDNVDRDGVQAISDSHGVTEALTYDVVYLQGVLTVAATAGDLSLLAAQNADHADDTVVHAESFMRATKVA